MHTEKFKGQGKLLLIVEDQLHFSRCFLNFDRDELWRSHRVGSKNKFRQIMVVSYRAQMLLDIRCIDNQNGIATGIGRIKRGLVE